MGILRLPSCPRTRGGPPTWENSEGVEVATRQTWGGTGPSQNVSLARLFTSLPATFPTGERGRGDERRYMLRAGHRARQ